MNQEKIGKFILNLRKKKNLTQSEFANILSVTAQAVSKWENGRGIPDIELLKKISEEFKVDISEILDGEIKRKKNKNLVVPFILMLIVAISIVITIIIKHNDFEFKTLSSSNTEFKVKGVAAYSNDRKSIYISGIEYLGKENEDKEYFIIECALYEKNNDIERRIASYINESKHEDEFKPLKELLALIEFNIDNYTSACKDITTDSLYISISALDINNKTTNYKIPLKIEDNCTK